jgi:hypothetical protein
MRLYVTFRISTPPLKATVAGVVAPDLSAERRSPRWQLRRAQTSATTPSLTATALAGVQGTERYSAKFAKNQGWRLLDLRGEGWRGPDVLNRNALEGVNDEHAGDEVARMLGQMRG